jgi:hypothetical protein
MNAVAILSIILLLAGSLWFAWEVYQREDLIWAVLLVLVPFPLLGLYIWYRAGWESYYRNPALFYLGGYALALIVRAGH